MKKLSELLNNLNHASTINYNSEEIYISNLVYDSRKTIQDSLFFAIKGVNSDGHNFISSAIDNGAKAIVCEYIPESLKKNNNTIFVLVHNSRKALAEFSHNWFDEPSKRMKIIGVTGTNGKTTITFLLKSIIDNAGYKTAVIGTTGILIGDKEITATHTTPESLETAELMANMVDSNVDYCIMEVSSHALHQHRADGIDFDAAIFTNLSHDHLDYHKTMDNYAAAKNILFDMLKPIAIAIVNGDDKYADLMIKDCTNYRRIGRNVDNEIIIRNEILGIRKTSFDLNDHNFEILLPGRFNIENAALSIVTAIEIGIDHSIIKDAIMKANGAPGRMERIALQSGAVAIVDYAHTPDALQKALQTCREIIDQSDKQGQLVCVFGCGGDRDSTKRPIMGKYASEIADQAIITNDNPRTEDPNQIINDILSGILQRSKCTIIKDRKEAIKSACNNANGNDIILIAGKGHEKYQIIGSEKLHFDDVEEVKYFSK